MSICILYIILYCIYNFLIFLVFPLLAFLLIVLSVPFGLLQLSKLVIKMFLV